MLPHASPPHRFASTRWSLVAAAGRDDPAGRAALEDLCRAYWYPLYVFARRSGCSAEDAADMTQGFFASLVEKAWVLQADASRGKFRTFLLAAFRHFTSNERARAGAKKRGGDQIVLSLDVGEAESRLMREPAAGRTAEQVFQRRYALTLLDRAWERLAAGQRAGSASKAERFDALKPYLEGDAAPRYREVGASLGMSETAVKVAVHRLRGKFRDALRAEVADTLGEEADIDAEILDLMEALDVGDGPHG